MNPKLEDTFTKALDALTNTMKKYREHEAEYDNLIEKLHKALGDKLVNFCYAQSSSSIDFHVAGTPDDLKVAWAVLRNCNYTPDYNVPKDDKLANFSTFWRHAEDYDRIKLWLNFSSTVCHRVKVGTKMQEVDVYEVRCE